MSEYLFNVDHGYLEGLVRGFRSGILTRVDYLNLVQCETVDGESMDKTCVRLSVFDRRHQDALFVYNNVTNSRRSLRALCQLSD